MKDSSGGKSHLEHSTRYSKTILTAPYEVQPVQGSEELQKGC